MKTINEKELNNITGGRNKLAYKIGHYLGKGTLAAGAGIGIAVGAAALL